MSPPPHYQLDGMSFAPLLSKKMYNKPYKARTEIAIASYGRSFRSAFTTKWKLYGDGEFFNIADDPREENPVHTPPPQAREIYKKLQARLQQIKREAKGTVIGDAITQIEQRSPSEIRAMHKARFAKSHSSDASVYRFTGK